MLKPGGTLIYDTGVVDVGVPFSVDVLAVLDAQGHRFAAAVIPVLDLREPHFVPKVYGPAATLKYLIQEIITQAGGHLTSYTVIFSNQNANPGETLQGNLYVRIWNNANMAI